MGMHTCEPLRAHHVPRVCARMYACRALTRRRWMLTRFPVHPRENTNFNAYIHYSEPLSCEELSGPAFSPAHYPIRPCCPTAAHPSSSSTWSPSFCAWPCGMKLRTDVRRAIAASMSPDSLPPIPFPPCVTAASIPPRSAASTTASNVGDYARLPIYSLSSFGRCHGHVRWTIDDRDVRGSLKSFSQSGCRRRKRTGRNGSTSRTLAAWSVPEPNENHPLLASLFLNHFVVSRSQVQNVKTGQISHEQHIMHQKGPQVHALIIVTHTNRNVHFL